jgi:DNA-binding response OmpR family regulator
VRLLLVEDEDRIASFIRKGLSAAGYTVEHVTTGAEARARASSREFDLAILDLGLPDVDGRDVLRSWRDLGLRLPVVILTARGEVQDRVEGLELGADDYLTKPFAFDELLARIRVRLRPQAGADATTVRFRDVELDLRTRRVTVRGRSIELAPREFGVLEAFLRNPGHVLSREQLLSRVWGYDFDPQSNLVDVYVGYLRKKLGDGYIETVRGAGYRLRPQA